MVHGDEGPRLPCYLVPTLLALHNVLLLLLSGGDYSPWKVTRMKEEEFYLTDVS
jgi:hypothetical protein